LLKKANNKEEHGDFLLIKDDEIKGKGERIIVT
jgi:hypothetical protein